jgi:hypothetical protein
MAPMFNLSPLSAKERRKSDFGAVRSVDDPKRTLQFGMLRPWSSGEGQSDKMDGFLSKPLSGESLIERLEMVLIGGDTRPPPHRALSARHRLYGFL